MRYYYSAQSFLAWVLNTYFFGGRHYTYLAPFLPYRLPNPSTSNPHEVFSRLYKPWVDEDEYDPVVAQNRIGLRKGVMVHEKRGHLADDEAARLKSICDRVSIKFFCPIVYRVDLDSIDPDRMQREGSAKSGSEEYLISDLQDREFDVLFFDYRDDDILRELFDQERDDLDSVYTTLEMNYVGTK